MAASRTLAPVQSAHARDQLDDLRAFITVTRTDPRDVQVREVIVRLDARPKFTVMYGDTFTLELAPGFHRLRVHNTLMWRTFNFAVEPGEHLEFAIVNRRGLLLQLLLAVLPSPVILTVVRRSLR